MMMNLLAISGSLRAASTNSALTRAAAALAPDGVRVSIYEGLDSLLHFSPDRDGDAAPDAAREWRAQVGAADGVLFVTPEYAFGIPGSLKNALDWLVTSGELWRKPVVVVSASPSAKGGEHAHAALLLTLSALEAELVPESSLMVSFVSTKVGKDGTVIDAATKDALRASVEALAEAARGPAFLNSASRYQNKH